MIELREVETARSILRNTQVMGVMKQEQPERYLRLEHLHARTYFDPNEVWKFCLIIEYMSYFQTCHRNKIFNPFLHLYLCNFCGILPVLSYSFTICFLVYLTYRKRNVRNGLFVYLILRNINQAFHIFTKSDLVVFHVVSILPNLVVFFSNIFLFEELSISKTR